MSQRPSRPRRLFTAVLACAAVAAAGCSSPSGGGSDGGSESVGRLAIMAPADPGGGWDQTARAMAASLEEADLVGSSQVTNVGGAGGTVGLAQLATERSEEYLMVMGLVMVGAVETNDSQATLADTTPIARLTGEDEIVVVPAASPYRTITDLVEDMRANGRAVSIAGGSAGGTDHILAALIAKDAGIPIEDLNYVAYSGGGETQAALLGNQVSAGISGVGEYAELVAAGELRALAVSGAERVEGIDAPTLIESGYDVELNNWRGVVGPPNLAPEARDRLLQLVENLHASPAWRDQVAKNGWQDVYLAGDEFAAFLAEEQPRVREVLVDIGLVQ